MAEQTLDTNKAILERFQGLENSSSIASDKYTTRTIMARHYNVNIIYKNPDVMSSPYDVQFNDGSRLEVRKNG